ncbi:TPA: hypothetical protein ACS72F_000849 [Providencia alcalifaciens]
MMSFNGIEYEFGRGSDIVRDGMYLELTMANTDPVLQMAEVFYSDVTHQFTLTCFEPNIPLEIIETLIEQAKKLLPPIEKQAKIKPLVKRGFISVVNMWTSTID